MILQALTQYYERKSSAEEGVLPPIGFEIKNIPVVAEIDVAGNLVQLRINDRDSGSSEYIVPQSVKRSVNILANTLWDTAEYALGIDTRDDTERVVKQHEDFIDKIKSMDEPAASDPGILALITFLNSFDPKSIKDNRHWDYMMTNPNVTFQLQGDDRLICQRPSVIDTLQNTGLAGTQSLCLVSGEMDEPERLHPSIKGVSDAQSSGANIVAFNLDAFNSFGKSQGLNAPVGKCASFLYTTALNHLLRKGSDQRFQVGDASTVFWSAAKTDFENHFGTIFGSKPNLIKDDPDKYISAIKSVFNAVYRGKLHNNDSDQEFYVLGLSPNAARISVRFWIVDNISKIAERIKQHFDYLQIIHNEQNQEFLPLQYLLKKVAIREENKNIPPNLSGEVMQSILSGHPYPYTFFAAAIQRCKVTQCINYPRAAIIKAYLNKLSNEEDITVELNKNSKYQSYQLGRLFAVLEKSQEDASDGKLNETIRSRYYASASANPVSVFSTLCKLNNHHISKMEKDPKKKSWAIMRQKDIQEIVSHLPDDKPFPATFNLVDQGRFAVGYYHQRQNFFIKKTSTESGESS